MQKTRRSEQVLSGRVRSWAEVKGLAGSPHLTRIVEATTARFRLLPLWQRVVMLTALLLAARTPFGTGGVISGVADRWIAVSASSAAVQLLVTERTGS